MSFLARRSPHVARHRLSAICTRGVGGLVAPDRDSGAPQLESEQPSTTKSMEGQVAFVVGGVGAIGRGICSGLLKAGATVLINGSSSERLAQLQRDLKHPDNLVCVKGTMRPEGADSLVHEVMEMTNGRINHVVAHCGVRWWAPEGTSAGGPLENMMTSGKDTLDLQTSEFIERAPLLPALHFAAAQRLLLRLRDVPGASYTFVTGVAGERRSVVSQVNIHAVWGLAAYLREFYKDSPLTVTELRVNLKVQRPARERAFDPRERPLSADIGEICAGIASSTDPQSRKLYHLDNAQDIGALKWKFPCPMINQGLPTLWHWQGA